jgi:hypothetical protein
MNYVIGGKGKEKKKAIFIIKNQTQIFWIMYQLSFCWNFCFIIIKIKLHHSTSYSITISSYYKKLLLVAKKIDWNSVIIKDTIFIQFYISIINYRSNGFKLKKLLNHYKISRPHIKIRRSKSVTSSCNYSMKSNSKESGCCTFCLEWKPSMWKMLISYICTY